jgi:hypothetical protein
MYENLDREQLYAVAIALTNQKEGLESENASLQDRYNELLQCFQVVAQSNARLTSMNKMLEENGDENLKKACELFDENARLKKEMEDLQNNTRETVKSMQAAHEKMQAVIEQNKRLQELLTLKN